MSLANKLSNYPNGFNNGIAIAGLPIHGIKEGNTYWVNSAGGEVAASDTNPGTRQKPFATLDYAIGRCTANNGDIIFVGAGHAETITADSGVDVDVAGVTIIGLGNGEKRPVFTFTTATTADFKLAADNVKLFNCIFKCNIAAQDMMIEVSGDAVEIGYCEFREGSATGKNFITVGVADNDADLCHIHHCRFYMPTAGNGDSAISIAKDQIGVTIEYNNIYGDFDLAGINIPASGNAQVNLIIRENEITNLLTGQHAIQINGTSSTGKLINNWVETDAQATSIDAGGLESYGNLYHSGTDQTEAVPALFSESQTPRIVLKSTGDLTSFGTSMTLFTVTGDVLCKVGASVDVAVTSTSGTTTLEVGVSGNTACLCVQDVVDNTAFAVGDSWTLVTAADANGAQMADEWVLIGNSSDIILTASVDDITAGDIDFYCQYIPLTAGSSVVAA